MQFQSSLMLAGVLASVIAAPLNAGTVDSLSAAKRQAYYSLKDLAGDMSHSNEKRQDGYSPSDVPEKDQSFGADYNGYDGHGVPENAQGQAFGFQYKPPPVKRQAMDQNGVVSGEDDSFGAHYSGGELVGNTPPPPAEKVAELP